MEQGRFAVPKKKGPIWAKVCSWAHGALCLEGRNIDGIIPCQCDKHSKDCQSYHNDYEIFQGIGLSSYGHKGSEEFMGGIMYACYHKR